MILITPAEMIIIKIFVSNFIPLKADRDLKITIYAFFNFIIVIQHKISIYITRSRLLTGFISKIYDQLNNRCQWQKDPCLHV